MKLLSVSFLILSLLLGEGTSQTPYIVVLGIAQDGGIPHTNCNKKCCRDEWDKNKSEKVSCIGLVDPRSNQSWLVDATPDFPQQYHTITNKHKTKLEGIFLTHAHIGHYSGLMYLGREVMGAKMMKVFVMPRMESFIKNNGPWNQLVELNNIILKKITARKEIKVNNQLFIKPILVPHRDEYSETVSYQIMGPNKSLLYIPDIDKWTKWEEDILLKIKYIDLLLVDGTFFSSDEIPNRDISEIPHPSITESMNLFSSLSTKDRNKVFFIHLNHTNPAIKRKSAAQNIIKSKRFNIAYEGMKFSL
tara:strand:+ start:233 stop:1144 length:912 start_codon:yes stop_codon:yes gene_type:complete